MAFKVVSCVLAISLIGNISSYPRLERAISQPAKVDRNIQSTYAASQDKDAIIVDSNNDFDPTDNSYTFGFQSSNGITYKGSTKGDKVSVEGSYFITSADGVPVQVVYIANENGFQAQSDAIPTPHPIIAKMIEYLRSLPPVSEEEDKKEHIAKADI